MAIACGFAALCYAELASMIPIAGSAYTYAYATLGEIFAWIIGWDLILEYAVSNMAVAVGFSAYFNDLLDSVFGFICRSHCRADDRRRHASPGAGSTCRRSSCCAADLLLVRGVRESAGTNNMMVLIKIAAILIFVFGAARAVQTANWHPFMPNGFSGVLTGAAIVFFTYIGFDSVSTAAEECKHPQRDLPFGIIMTLVVCTMLYICGGAGADRHRPLEDAEQRRAGGRCAQGAGIQQHPRVVVNVGAIVGMLSSLLVFQYGQARVWFAMSRDGLLPRVFSNVHPVYRRRTSAPGSPASWSAFRRASGISARLPICRISARCSLSSWSAGVIVRPQAQPDRPRGFRVPLVPWIPRLQSRAVSC